MTVRDLKRLQNNRSEYLADLHRSAIFRQKLGFGLQTINKQAILETIVVESLLKANELSLDSDALTIPEWCDFSSFNQFISKIQENATNKFS